MSEESETPTSFIAPSIEELSPLFPAYQIEAFIAQGGMGAVYKATQKSLDRPVAIKILPREFGEDAQFRASFEAEAKAMARLNHPNLIGVYDFGDADGMLFIIMEYVQGKALYYSIHKKAIDPTIALDIISKISRGLSHAHKAGILHRDIKPANILLDPNAEPKIGDFGLARPMDAKRGEGLAFGTPGYTAPEVYADQGQPIDQRSDIFSVGAMLFELVKGRTPADGATNMKTGFDPRFDALLSKATHANPNLRFTDVDEFADQLDALAPKLSGPRLATTVRPTSPLPSVAPAPTLPSSKSSTLPTLIIIGLILAGAGFAYLNSQKKEKIAPPQPPEIIEPIVEKPAQKPSKKHKQTSERPTPKKNRQPEPTPTPEPEPEPNPTPTPEKKPNTPNENRNRTLKQLQQALLAGNFTKLPRKAVKKGNSAYLLYSKATSWLQAHALAETYGASLATPESAEELRFLRDTFPPHTPHWIGASDSGIEGKWHWINGSPLSQSFWAKNSPDNNSEASPAGEDFAGLTLLGIQDFSGSATHQPIFEWKLDGSRTASLEAQLARTASCIIKKSPPIFPAPAFEFKGSRYLLLKKSLTYQDATLLAEKAGGHLAVLSSQEEAQHLASHMNSTLQKSNECWFGGHRNKEDPEAWKTPTGETFTFHHWIPGTPDSEQDQDSALEYTFASGTDNKGFNDTPPHLENDYLLIEWSHPSLRNMPTSIVEKSLILETLEEIHKGFRLRHGRDYQRYAKKRTKIISTWIEDATKKIENDRELPQAIKSVAIETLQGYQEKQKLPDKLPPATPDSIKRSFDDATEELSELWDEYDSDWQDAKSHYTEALEDANKDALKKGQATLSDLLVKEIAATKNKEHLFIILSGEHPIVIPE